MRAWKRVLGQEYKGGRKESASMGGEWQRGQSLSKAWGKVSLWAQHGLQRCGETYKGALFEPEKGQCEKGWVGRKWDTPEEPFSKVLVLGQSML